MEEAIVMVKLLEFCLSIGIVMVFGYTCGAMAFRLQEKYYGKNKDDHRG